MNLKQSIILIFRNKNSNIGASLSNTRLAANLKEPRK
jgi:hypothetical protein